MHEYRELFLSWRRHGVITYTRYILGFPNDTLARIARDIRTIQEELPVDLLEFFVLTPLPGSEDHQKLHKAVGLWMDPDMNKYDVEHVTTGHALMMPAGMGDGIPDRLGTLLFAGTYRARPAPREGLGAAHRAARQPSAAILVYLPPGTRAPAARRFFRRKLRSQRRPGLKRENPLMFPRYPRRAWEVVDTQMRLIACFVRLHRLRHRIERDPAPYTDRALTLPEADTSAFSPGPEGAGRGGLTTRNLLYRPGGSG